MKTKHNVKEKTQFWWFQGVLYYLIKLLGYLKFIMSQQPFYPDEITKKRCLEELRQSNKRLELYNLFLDEAIAQVDAELRQQKRIRLSQGHS